MKNPALKHVAAKLEAAHADLQQHSKSAAAAATLDPEAIMRILQTLVAMAPEVLALLGPLLKKPG